MKKIFKSKFHWHIILIVISLTILSVVSWIQFVTNIEKSMSAHYSNENATITNAVNTSIDVNTVASEKNDIVEISKTDVFTTPKPENILSFGIKKIDLLIDKIDSKWSVYHKKSLSKIDSLLTYYTTGEISSVQVIGGDDNWLFYKSQNDGDTIADYTGTNEYTETELLTFTQSALSTQKKLNDMGIEFAILVAPNKEHIYSEYMPASFYHCNLSRTDLLVEEMRKHGVNIVSPKKELLEKHTNYQVYYSYDTHWNQLGAYIGTRDILATWDIFIPDLPDRKISSYNLKENYHYCAKDDLAVLTGLLSVLDDEIEYEIDGTIKTDWETFEKEQEQNANQLSYFYTKEAANNKTILLIGDSFRTAMIPTLRETFSDVYVIYRSHFTSNMLNEISPDYVLLEYVERYSSDIKHIKDMLFY